MDNKGGRYSIFISNGDPDPQLDENRIYARIKAASTIFLSLSVSSKKVLHLLDGCRAEILLDLHDYDGKNPWYDDFIACADVVQLSDVALRQPRPIIDRLLSGCAKQIVLTKGDNGAEIFTQSEHIKIPACPADMIDSNGAGDTFSVALWNAQKTGQNLPEAGKFAATAAAFSIEDASLFPAHVSTKQIRKRTLSW